VSYSSRLSVILFSLPFNLLLLCFVVSVPFCLFLDPCVRALVPTHEFPEDIEEEPELIDAVPDAFRTPTHLRKVIERGVSVLIDDNTGLAEGTYWPLQEPSIHAARVELVRAGQDCQDLPLFNNVETNAA